MQTHRSRNDSGQYDCSHIENELTLVNRSAIGLLILGVDLFLYLSSELTRRRNSERDPAIKAAARIEYFDRQSPCKSWNDLTPRQQDWEKDCGVTDFSVARSYDFGIACGRDCLT